MRGTDPVSAYLELIGDGCVPPLGCFLAAFAILTGILMLAFVGLGLVVSLIF